MIFRAFQLPSVFLLIYTFHIQESHFHMPHLIRSLFQITPPAHWGYHVFASLLSTLASPGWWLLQSGLQPQLSGAQLPDESSSTSTAFSFSLLSYWVHRLIALEPSPLLSQLLPVLMLCFLVNMLYYGALVRLLCQVFPQLARTYRKIKQFRFIAS